MTSPRFGASLASDFTRGRKLIKLASGTTTSSGLLGDVGEDDARLDKDVSARAAAHGRGME